TYKATEGAESECLSRGKQITPGHHAINRHTNTTDLVQRDSLVWYKAHFVAASLLPARQLSRRPPHCFEVCLGRKPVEPSLLTWPGSYHAEHPCVGRASVPILELPANRRNRCRVPATRASCRAPAYRSLANVLRLGVVDDREVAPPSARLRH